MHGMSGGKLNGVIQELSSKYKFSGGPKHVFESVGRNTFVTLLQQGMMPDSLVLDYGCGVMRLGYWIIRFLDPGCYHGIEPNSDHLTMGKNVVIGPDLLAEKMPVFSSDANFNLAVFGKKFDFIVARSIFTHFTPEAIDRALASCAAALNDNGIFIASFWPVDVTEKKNSQVLVGETLMDRPAKSGINVAYREDTLIEMANRHGLQARRLQQPVCNSQPWIKFELAQAKS